MADSKRTLGVIVDALQRPDIEVIDKHIQPKAYGELITIRVAPRQGLYKAEKLEEFRRGLIPELPIKGIMFMRTYSSIIMGKLGYSEEVPTVEIGSPELKDPKGRRHILIEIYANRRMAKDYLHGRLSINNNSISPWTLRKYKLKAYGRRALNYALGH